MDFKKKYGSWALIAGGSEGIGAEFARQLAAKGLNLVLLARDEPILEETARVLVKEFSVVVRTVSLDLAEDNLMDKLQSVTQDAEIGLLVYNAANPLIGDFLAQSWENHQHLLKVNVLVPCLLVHHFGQMMQKRAKGGIILLSSMAGRQGTAKVAHYAASKAYNLIFAEGLWAELSAWGIDVLAVCPGTTRTPGWERSQANLKGLIMPPIQEPKAVVQEALRALGHKPSIIPGFWNRLSAFFLNTFLSRKQAIQIISRNTRRMFEK